MHTHCCTRGSMELSMEIPKLLPLSSVSVASLFFLQSVSMSSELLLSNFVTFHVANHIYNGACILSITVHTHDARTYHGHHILPFTICARVMLIHTITYLPVWGSFRLAPIRVYNVVSD